MPTAEKVAVVEELAEILKQAKGIYLTDFTGLSVPAMTELRKCLTVEDVSYRVIKNRLAKLAAQKAEIVGLDEMLTGPTGLVYSDSDPVLPARLLAEFAGKSNGRPTIKLGFIEGDVFRDEQLEALAKLPPREILLGQLVTAVQSPLSNLAFCLQGILQKLVGTLYALAEKRREEGEGEAAS